MYVAVKGGEAAIANAHRAARRPPARRSRSCRRLRLDQIVEQLALGVDRVMSEGSLYDRELAALAIVQARGDLIEAIFLVRAYRTTLPRFGYTQADRHRGDAGRAPRFGDLQGPAGRPVARADLRLHAPPARSRAGRRAPMSPSRERRETTARADAARLRHPRRRRPDRGRMASCRSDHVDRRHHPRAAGIPDGSATSACRRCRAAMRVSCWRSAIRRSAAMAATIPSSARSASARSRSSSTCPNSPSPCRSAASASPNARWSTSSRARPRRRRNSPAATAWCSARASARRWPCRCATGRCAPRELGEDIVAPAQDEEFVISHSDNVQATGFVEHLKLPHYVDFQAELDLVRRMRAEHDAAKTPPNDAAQGGRRMTIQDQASPPTTSPISTSRPSG